MLGTPLGERDGAPCLALDGNQVLFEAGPREALVGIDLLPRPGLGALPGPQEIGGVRFQYRAP